MPYLAAKSLCTMFLLSRYFIPAAIWADISKILVYDIVLSAPADVDTSDAPLDVDVVVDVDDSDVAAVDVAVDMVTRDNCRR